MKELQIKLNREMLQALFEGKKCEQVFMKDWLGAEIADAIKVTIFPDRYGVFMTWDKFAEIKRAAQMQAMEVVIDLIEKTRKDQEVLT